MKKENLKNNDLDKAFREGLNDFQVPPPSFHKQEDGSKLDDALRSKIGAFEMQPAEENWDKIKRRIPLSLSMQRHLNLWSKIAAVLIVGLATSLLLANYWDFQNGMVDTETEVKPTAPAFPIEADFVYELRNRNAEQNSADEDGYKTNEVVEENLEVVTVVPPPVEELQKLPATPLNAVVSSDNPLNETIQREGTLGDMPLQMQKPVEEAILSITTDDEAKAASKKQNQ